MPDVSDGGDPVLEIRDLNAWYGESHVLHGMDINVREGEVVTLLGRNGAGKTTLLRSIMGVVRKRKGMIRFAGADLLDVPMHKVPRLGIGYVPEERGIFASLNVEENLMLPRVVRDGAMSLEAIYTLFPNLKGRETAPGTRLSGGEQQMLAMARILRTGATTILLDEPSEGLAPVIIEQIGIALRELKEKGFTILLVEQNFRFASSVADRHYVVEEGAVIDEIANVDLSNNIDKLNKYLGV